jgi:hypothetical protein
VREDVAQEVGVPLSEEEQKVLREIERSFYENDPDFAREVSSRTLYKHTRRNLKWATLGFVGGLVVLVTSFASSLILGMAGFLLMLGSAFVFERNLRKEGKSRLQDLRESVQARDLGDLFGDTRRKLRDRFNKD